MVAIAAGRDERGMGWVSSVLAEGFFRGARCSGFLARPSRGFVPAADLLFAPPKSRQKALPCETARHSRVPCDARNPGPHPTHFATLRSNKGVRSQSLKLAALAPRASALLGGLEGEAPHSPTANSQTRSPAGGCIPLTPFSPAEERKTRSPRAQHASRTDSRRLFEQSVATRVRRGASGLSTAGNPSNARAGRSGGALWLLSGGPESDSPAGAKSRHRTHAPSHRHDKNPTKERMKPNALSRQAGTHHPQKISLIAILNRVTPRGENR